MLARLGQMLRRIDSAGVGGGCRAPPRASHGRDVGACATFRDNSLDYAGLPGECWIPVPLPPPPRRRSAPNIWVTVHIGEMASTDRFGASLRHAVLAVC